MSKDSKPYHLKEFIEDSEDTKKWCIQDIHLEPFQKQVITFFESIDKLMKNNKFMFHYEQENINKGKTQIGDYNKYLGYLLAESVGQDLYHIYGKYAMVNIYYEKQTVFSKIRSPLRKFGDVLGAYQLMAFMLNKDEIEMMKFVTNRDDMTPEKFEKIILYIN